MMVMMMMMMLVIVIREFPSNKLVVLWHFI